MHRNEEPAEWTDQDDVKPNETTYVKGPESNQIDQKPHHEADRDS